MIRIGDFANIFNVSIKTIRFYEEKGLLKPSYVDIYSGYRYFDEKNIEEMSRIIALKDLGLELSEIKNISDETIKDKIEEFKNKVKKINNNIDILFSLSNEKGGMINLKTFINDEKAIGKWSLVGVFNKKEDYPNNTNNDIDFKINELYLMPGGEEYWVISWTKSNIYINDVSNPYQIEDDIMFVDIKSPVDENDYFVAVYKKEDSNVYTADSIKIKDDITISFEEDEEVVGSWKSIGIINHSDDLDNIEKYDNLFLMKAVFEKDGEIIIKYSNGLKSSKYTKNKIVNFCCSDTLSNYEIKEKDGVKYLVVEWKSGDYIFGGMINCYYVLVKE